MKQFHKAVFNLISERSVKQRSLRKLGAHKGYSKGVHNHQISVISNSSNVKGEHPLAYNNL